jgi:hypothetical protein
MAPNQGGDYSNVTFTAYDQRGVPYQVSAAQDAANEAAKHEAAFNPQAYYGFKYGDLANVPLSQIASMYGSNAADSVQGHFTQYPTANYLAITQQYNQQHQILQNPFPENTAAGIAWEVNKTGGSVGMTLGGKSYSEGYNPIVNMSVEHSTVPIPDHTDMLTGGNTVGGFNTQGIDIYVPYGNYTQEKIENAKILMDFSTGELAIYQQPAGHSILNLVGGGGRNALQSGMFTVNKAETPYVTSQYGAGTYILPSGTGLSRLGAEAYGGVVRSLNSENLLAPNEAISRYYGEGSSSNLANLVQQVAGGKAEAPGANIPWSISPNSPAIQYMNENGIIPGAVVLPGHLTGGGMVAGMATVSDITQGKPDVVSTIMRPSDIDLWAAGLNIPYLSGALVASSDFFLGGRTMEVTTKGQPTNLPSVTTIGVPTQTITAVPGGYQITTSTPYTTTGGQTIPYTTTSTPLPSGFAFGESQFVKQVTAPIIPNLTYRDTGILPLNYLEAGGIGLVQGIREKPLTAAVYAGAGVLMVAGGEVITGLGAETLVATGHAGLLGTVAFEASNFATAAPIALATLYGMDVIGRSISWGKDYSPAAAQRFGVISSTEVIPMLAGGAAFAYRGDIMSGINEAYASVRYGNERITGGAPAPGGSPFDNPVYQGHVNEMSNRAVALTEHLTRGDLENNIGGFNRAMGFGNEQAIRATPEELPFGQNPWQDELATWRMSSWDMTTPKLPLSASTELATVPFERTPLGSAYDITRTNLNYAPDLQSVIIESNRDIITQGNYGKIAASQKSSLMTVDVGEYARATGTDLMPKNAASAGFADVYKIETIRDAYPSGMVYENTIGRKGTVETAGLPGTVQISSRGIAYGQGTIERNAMIQANDILDNAIARRPIPTSIISPIDLRSSNVIWMTRTAVSPRISSTDLPSIIRDLSSGYGNVNIEGSGSVGLGVVNTRVVRATTPYEQIFGEYAIQNAGNVLNPLSTVNEHPLKQFFVEEPNTANIVSGIGLGVTQPGTNSKLIGFEYNIGDYSKLFIREGKYAGVEIGSRRATPSSLFETLPNYGVIGSEVISTYEGTPLIPVTYGGETFDVNAGIKDILFGKYPNAFESEATRLREGAGIEKVRRPYDVHKQPITSLSKTFGRQRSTAGSADIGSGKLKQIAAVSQDFIKTETNRIGSSIEEILGKARAQTVSQPQRSETISGGGLDMLAPSRLEDIAFPSGPSPISRGRTVLFEEGGEQSPSAEALRRTGISERAGFKEPYRGHTREESIIDMVAARGFHTGLMSGSIQSTHLDQTQKAGQRTEIRSITDIMSGSMVISQTRIGQVQKVDTIQDVMRDMATITGQNIGQEKVSDTRQQQDILVGFKQITDQTQRQITDTRITTRPDIITTNDIWRIPPPDIPKFPLGGLGSGGGGSGIFADVLRTKKRNYGNPVVDIDYLAGLYASPGLLSGTRGKKGSSAPVRLLTGQLRSSAKHPHKGGKK